MKTHIRKVKNNYKGIEHTLKFKYTTTDNEEHIEKIDVLSVSIKDKNKFTKNALKLIKGEIKKLAKEEIAKNLKEIDAKYHKDFIDYRNAVHAKIEKFKEEHAEEYKKAALEQMEEESKENIDG